MSLLLVISRAPVQASAPPASTREFNLVVPAAEPLERICTEPPTESELSVMPLEMRFAPEAIMRLPAPEMPAVVVLLVGWVVPVAGLSCSVPPAMVVGAEVV